MAKPFCRLEKRSQSHFVDKESSTLQNAPLQPHPRNCKGDMYVYVCNFTWSEVKCTNEKHMTWGLGDTKSKTLGKLFQKFDPQGPSKFFQRRSSSNIFQSSPSWKRIGTLQECKLFPEKKHGFQQKPVAFPVNLSSFRASGCPMAPLGRRAAARWAAREFLEGLEDASTTDGERGLMINDGNK